MRGERGGGRAMVPQLLSFTPHTESMEYKILWEYPGIHTHPVPCPYRETSNAAALLDPHLYSLYRIAPSLCVIQNIELPLVLKNRLLVHSRHGGIRNVRNTE